VLIMMFRMTAIAAGLVAAAVPFAAPAQADTGSNVTDFLTTIDSLGIGNLDPAQAVELGQSVCPLLAERGQNTADIAAKVADTIGRPLGPATIFTGAAVSFLCPRAVDNITGKLADGGPLLPLFG
jgi:hypothetical protein